MSDENMLTVGQRADGMYIIYSAPSGPGRAEGTAWVMTREHARWLANKLVQMLDADLATTSASPPVKP